jgi:hypothetical protein
VKQPVSVKRSAKGHVVLLWTYLDSGKLQRRCSCERWESDVMRDTPENRRILTLRADEHLAAVPDAA